MGWYNEGYDSETGDVGFGHHAQVGVKVSVQKTSQMKSLEEYVALAGQSHGHMCPGQVLGIRMAMLGLGRSVLMIRSKTASAC